MNLKTKMTLSTSLVTAVLLSILALSMRWYFLGQMKGLIYSQQSAMVSAIAEQIDDKLLSMQTELVAAAGTLTRATLEDPARLRKFIANRPDTQAMFDNGIFVFSPRGNLLLTSPSQPEMLARNYAGRDYFRKTLSTRTAQISEPLISSQTHHHPIIVFTAPVFDPKGEMIAIIAGSLDLTNPNFLGKISSIRMGEGGYFYLFNRSRMLIAHPEKERIFTEYKMGAKTVEGDPFPGSGVTVERRNVHGVPVISAYTRLKTTGWTLGSNFPTKEAFRALHRTHNFLVLALLVVFVCSLFLVWFLMRRLTRPLIDFTCQIRTLTGSGESGPRRVTVEGSDEIGMLGVAFNQLFGELEEQKSELQRQLHFSQRVMDTTPIPVFYQDAAGKYIGCNRAFEKFTGLCREEVIGKTESEVARHEAPEVALGCDHLLPEREEPYGYETAMVNSEGLLREVVFFKNAFVDADGTARIIGAMLDITEPKQAHAALAEQKEFAEGLVENSSIPTFVLGCDHRVLIWNRACEELTGVKGCDVIGSDEVKKILHRNGDPCLADLVLDADAESLARYLSKHGSATSLANGVMAETWYTDWNGKAHYVVTTAARIPDGHGNVIGAIQTIEDITDRKRAEDAHEKTRRELQLILDAAGEGIYGVDMLGMVTFVNPAAAQMLGWEQQEILGSHQHSLAHHTMEDGTPYPEEECPMFQAVRDGRTLHGSELFWRKDGTSFPIEFVTTPIRENGELVGAVVIFKDTTERNLVEEQLLKLSQAVVQSPVSIIITDTSGNIEYVNPKFTQISGYQAAEVLERKPSMLRSGKTSEEVYKDLWNTISSGKVWSGEIYNKRKDGEIYCEHATISPIRNGAGVISHYMAFKENVSDRKRLEEQLRHAQKMEAIGQLAGGVAHDFNNILTVIMGFGQILHYSLDLEDPKRGHMEQILDAADRATHLTKSLLTFSRKQVMLLQQVELNELSRKLSTFLIRIIGEDVTLKTSLTEERLVVLADSGQLEQVLMNLATNARDAMPGGGELSISTESILLGKEFHQQHGFGTPGRYALVTITDTGSGMDSETVAKIFEPFFTTKAPGRGTGLGLSIVYGIVKQHGGYITISSEPGIGTTFSVYLPLVTEREEVVRKCQTMVPTGGSETILVVEDDPAVRRLVESVLKRFGYGVIVAESGEEAIDLFEQKWQDIDLALMDVIMPKMNGKQVSDALRSRSPRLKVLYLTGYTADVIQDKGIAFDGVDILMKPAKPMELARKVREMLDAA